jgi:putative transcription antitermination factor YqgF
MPRRSSYCFCFIPGAILLSAENIAQIGRRSLGIDYGFRRVGVAVSVGFAPRPLGCLPNAHRVATGPQNKVKIEGNRNRGQGRKSTVPDRLIEDVLDLALQEAVDQIVVGLPLHSDGLESDQSRETRVFAEKLAKATVLPVYLWDECFSTQEARAVLEANAIRSRRRIERQIDAESACVILREFYEYRGACAELVPGSTRKTNRVRGFGKGTLGEAPAS